VLPLLQIATAAAVFDEEKAHTEAIAVACDTIASALIVGCHKHQQSAAGTADVAALAMRQFIFWDQERARSCINRDYLGPQSKKKRTPKIILSAHSTAECPTRLITLPRGKSTRTS